MDKSGPKMLRGALMSGCAMWAPIFPPMNESGTDESSPGVALDSPLSATQDSIAISSGPMARAETLKAV